MKTLTESIEEILENTHNGCQCIGCTSKIYRVLVTKEFLALFRKLGEEVVGEDEVEMPPFKIILSHRNRVRKEQRERLNKLLK